MDEVHPWVAKEEAAEEEVPMEEVAEEEGPMEEAAELGRDRGPGGVRDYIGAWTTAQVSGGSLYIVFSPGHV